MQFHRLLAVLPAGQQQAGARDCRHITGGSSPDVDDKKMSKAEVLGKARRRISALEEDNRSLQEERKGSLEKAGKMKLKCPCSNQTMEIRSSGGNMSPSIFNTDTGPDWYWPIGHDASDRAGITAYEPDAVRFNQDEEAYYVKNKTNQANRNGSLPCKQPSKEQRSKGLQSSNGHISGSSSTSKGKARYMTTPSTRGENLVQLRAVSRKAKRTSVS